MISAAYSSERQSCLKANVVIDFIANYARRKEFLRYATPKGGEG
jgi:hypothetical protein